MWKVFVTRNLPISCLQRIRDVGIICDHYQYDSVMPPELLVKKVAGCNGILCVGHDKINESVIKSAGHSLKVVSTISAGYNHVDTELLKAQNIKLGHTPNVLTEATAELAVALLLTTSRLIPEGLSIVKNSAWSSWKLFWLCGQGLKDKCVGIIGMGNIGKAVARRLEPFSIDRLLYFNRSGKEGDTVNVNGLSAYWSSWEYLLHHSDFVIVCCSLNDSTEKLFDAEAFSMMKPNAIFINVSRGGVVDQEALYEALTSGQIHSAGLDVTDPEPLDSDHPLLQLPNCVILPHLGCCTIDTQQDMVDLAVDNVIAGVLGKRLKAEVTL